jgi:hypothetical protein
LLILSKGILRILNFNIPGMVSNKVLLFLTALFFLSISNLSPAQQNEKCVAVITGITGEVSIKRLNDSQFSKASWGSQLFSGDQVKTSSKSDATLAFSNNSIIKLGMNSQITISGDESTTGSTGANMKNASAGMMISLSEVISKKDNEKEEGAIAGVRSINVETPIELVSPVNTFIKTSRPSFLWTAREKYSSYIVTVYSSTGPVWSRKVTGNSLNYPDNEKDLENGGSYFWNVEGEAMIDTEKSGNRKFSVISTEKSKEISEQENTIRNAFRDDPESSSLHSLLGAYYVNQGLYHDALKEFVKVSEINADAPMPHEILGSIYTSVGNKDKAIEELQKALALSKSKGN